MDHRTAQDIRRQVDRIHKDLGYVDGSVHLEEVRDLLRLDLKYYTLKDEGLLSEVVHKLTLGVKQSILRPALLVDAVRKFDLKALFLPDRKRILIDLDLPDLKKRWSESHEIAHDFIEWHSDYLFGDDRKTLSPACHEQIEAEANFGAGCLLFPQRHFQELTQGSSMTLEKVRSIAEHFGNTITSTLWRFVENDEEQSFGLVSPHPHHRHEGRSVSEHLFTSRRFAEAFSTLDLRKALAIVQGYCSYRRAGPLGQVEIIIPDDSGLEHAFHAESFGNGHSVLTLVQHVAAVKTATVVSVPVSAATSSKRNR